MLLKRYFYLLIPLFFLGLASCTIPVTVNIAPRSSIQQSKDIQSANIPYSVEIIFNEDEVKSYRDYRFGSHDITYKFYIGKYLKDAIKYYVYPHFDQNSNENIILKIETFDIKGYEPEEEGGFSIRKSAVDVTLKTTIYYDNIVLYSIYTEGHSKVKVQFVDYSMWDAAQNAIIEAVKKIPNEVSQVLSNPEVARIRLKEDIERRLKNIGLNPSTTPLFVSDYIALANLSRLTKNYDEAIAAAKRAIELNSDNPASYVVLGLIYQERKKYKDSENSFKKAIALKPKSIPTYLKLAELYYEKEAYNETVNILSKALKIDPLSEKVNFLLLNTYMSMGKFEEAIKVEIVNEGTEIFTLEGIGVRIRREEDYPVVVTVLEESPIEMAGVKVGDKIIKINKQSAEGLEFNDLVKLLNSGEETQVTLTIKRGKNEFEIIVKRKTIIKKEESPFLAAFLAAKSFAYREKGNLDEAMKYAEKAYSVNPKIDVSKEALGAVYIDKGKYDEAITILSSTNSYFAKILLATAYAKSVKFKEAVNIYNTIPEDYLITKSVLRNNAINAFYETLKSYKNTIIQEVKTLEAKGQYKEAIKEYADYLKLADDKEAKEIGARIAELMIKYPHLFALSEEARKAVIRAEAYTAEGKFEKAIEEYKNALKLSPFFPAIYKAIALNYAQLKEYQKAIKNMNIYLELYPDAPDTRAAKDEIHRWEFLMEKEKYD